MPSARKFRRHADALVHVPQDGSRAATGLLGSSARRNERAVLSGTSAVGQRVDRCSSVLGERDWLCDARLASTARDVRVVERDNGGFASVGEMPSDGRLVPRGCTLGPPENVVDAAVELAVGPKLHPRDGGRALDLSAKERFAPAALASPSIDDGRADEPQRPTIVAGTEPEHARRPGKPRG